MATNKSVLSTIPPESVIDKASPVPLHHQLEQFLRKGISTGLFPPNETLPTERELQDHFDLSRTPVRQALGSLANDGLVIRRRSLGTVVLPRPFEEELTSLSTFTQEVKAKGHTPRAKMIALQQMVATQEIATNLSILAGDDIYEIVRLRLVDHSPVGLIYSYISTTMAPELSTDDFSEEGPRQSIYRTLLEKYDIKLTRATETFRAVNADKDVSRHLKLPKDSAVLLRSRIAFDSADTAIAFENGFYIAQYRIEWQGQEVRKIAHEYDETW
jgi:GntR family transcriptional regulator